MNPMTSDKILHGGRPVLSGPLIFTISFATRCVGLREADRASYIVVSELLVRRPRRLTACSVVLHAKPSRIPQSILVQLVPPRVLGQAIFKFESSPSV